MATKNSINNRSSELTVDPGASGDSFVQFDINGTGKFRIGVDDTDDSFRISQGSALGTNDTFVMTAAGERTLPLQPAFAGYQTTTASNATGNSTTYNYVTTELFDVGGNFNGTTFTAPISGVYKFFSGCTVDNLTDGDQDDGSQARINTSNSQLIASFIMPSPITVSEELTQSVCLVCYLDAGDTAIGQALYRGGSKTVGIKGGNSPIYTWFAGYLAC